MFLGKPRNARQGEPLHPRFLESVSAGLRVSRLDSEIDEASNGKTPLLTKPGLSKTVVSVMWYSRRILTIVFMQSAPGTSRAKARAVDFRDRPLIGLCQRLGFKTQREWI